MLTNWRERRPDRDFRRRIARDVPPDHIHVVVETAAVELPPRRAFMHLDTVFTLVDRHLCIAYTPVVAPGGPESARVYRVDLGSGELTFTLQDSLLGALAALGLELEMVPCGGDDFLEQQREQWTDGANAMCLGPGKIILYSRNVRTIEALTCYPLARTPTWPPSWLPHSSWMSNG